MKNLTRFIVVGITTLSLGFGMDLLPEQKKARTATLALKVWQKTDNPDQKSNGWLTAQATQIARDDQTFASLLNGNHLSNNTEIALERAFDGFRLGGVQSHANLGQPFNSAQTYAQQRKQPVMPLHAQQLSEFESFIEKYHDKDLDGSAILELLQDAGIHLGVPSHLEAAERKPLDELIGRNSANTLILAFLSTRMPQISQQPQEGFLQSQQQSMMMPNHVDANQNRQNDPENARRAVRADFMQMLIRASFDLAGFSDEAIPLLIQDFRAIKGWNTVSDATMEAILKQIREQAKEAQNRSHDMQASGIAPVRNTTPLPAWAGRDQGFEANGVVALYQNGLRPTTTHDAIVQLSKFYRAYYVNPTPEQMIKAITIIIENEDAVKLDREYLKKELN
jgi:hypothetical protein